ncbi:MAG: hypothetical protein AAGC68_12875 [Verrucomicrobiota bacterium]
MSAHSSIVEMLLRTDGHEFPVAQSGPGFLILREPAKIPAGKAEFEVRIDGTLESRELTLIEEVDGRHVSGVPLVETEPATA